MCLGRHFQRRSAEEEDLRGRPHGLGPTLKTQGTSESSNGVHLSPLPDWDSTWPAVVSHPCGHGRAAPSPHFPYRDGQHPHTVMQIHTDISVLKWLWPDILLAVLTAMGKITKTASQYPLKGMATMSQFPPPRPPLLNVPPPSQSTMKQSAFDTWGFVGTGTQHPTYNYDVRMKWYQGPLLCVRTILEALGLLLYLFFILTFNSLSTGMDSISTYLTANGKFIRGWRDGLAVRNTCCFCSGPGFSSQHPRSSSRVLTPVPGCLVPSSNLCSTRHVHGIHTCRKHPSVW